jgi:hypothetical protein
VSTGLSNAASGGMGLSSVLTAVFIVLKLTKVISWSWFWVLSPTIFSLALVVIIIAVVVLIDKLT